MSQELARVSIFLAAFSGLYFTVYAVTDNNYRQQFFAKIMRELARVVGARICYRELRRTAETEVPDSSGVEVLLDQGGDLVDGGLVVGADLHAVAVARAEGHDHQGRARVDGVAARSRRGSPPRPALRLLPR